MIIVLDASSAIASILEPRMRHAAHGGAAVRGFNDCHVCQDGKGCETQRSGIRSLGRSQPERRLAAHPPRVEQSTSLP